MPFRTITGPDGRRWRVTPTGFTTAYNLDEVGLMFVAGHGDEREVRVTHFSTTGSGARSRESAVAELSDEKLASLLRESQPSATAPETGYRRSPPGARLD